MNQLAREREKDVRELLKQGEHLREAQARVLEGGPPTELARAAERERDAVATLTEAARGLLEDAGHGTSEATLRKVGATLHAAAARPELAEELARGRLEREVAETALGFEALGALPSAPPAREGARRETRRDVRVEKARARLTEAQSELAEARAAEKAAAEELARREREAKQARSELRRLEDARERAEHAVERAQAALAKLRS